MGYRSWSKQIKKNTADIYLCTCCSGCFKPTIRRITAQITQILDNPDSIWGSDELSANALESNLNAHREQILNYLAEPKKDNYPTKTVNGSVVRSVLGMDSPCPVCGNTEAWQEADSLDMLEAAEPIRVFEHLEDAYEWVRRILKERKKELDKHAGTTDMEEILKKCEEINSVLERQREELNKGEANTAVRTLQQKEKALKERFEKIRSFGIEKKVAKEKLDTCSKELKNALERSIQEMHRAVVVQTKYKKELCALTRKTVKYLDKIVLTEKDPVMVFDLMKEGAEIPANRLLTMNPLPETVLFSE